MGASVPPIPPSAGKLTMASISTETSLSASPVVVAPSSRPVPPLAAGDRLTADEFLRRYEAMPDVDHAQLVEGVVYMPSPVSAEHGESHFRFNGLLFVYESNTPGIAGGDNSTLQLDIDNVPQPDGYLRILADAGGQAQIEGKYVVGAPEFIVEIAASSASYDLHDKLNAYRRNGVKEYVVWRVWDQAVDWFTLHEGRFQQRPAGDDGIYRSEALPGLWLDAAAVIAGDLARALEVLNQGLASAAHQEFATGLKAKQAAAE